MKELEQLYGLSKSIKVRQERMARDRSENEKNEKQIKELLEISGIKEMIISSFGDVPEEGIPSEQTLNRANNLMHQTTKDKCLYRYFHPGKDDFEVQSVEFNSETGQYRVQLEIVKNREYLGAFNYIIDTIWTPWFNG